eukprot:TRINITY_DN16150_c0_g1_i1.p1 TRINITY_DN16150_c0_g1~~TRINITY_DN16150_c0_g1_i1.p1  ORF type:complete len:868 (+),score=138.83 TRINITY_DN16150_c0_g1_i1:102-2606(+)
MVKKALCVGLNYPSTRHQLFGCVNDCLDWDKLLKDHFHFDETRVLIDQMPDGSPITAATQLPTRANILNQLGSWLVRGAEPQDVLVFVFAGHGCQVRTGYGQVDEALVPLDHAQVDAQGNPCLVMDDEIHALFSRLPAGCALTCIIDSCHGAHLLDVPTSVDTSQSPFRMLQQIERPREVPTRTTEGWERAIIPHAQGRPRFMPTVDAGPRQKRTPVGAGAHVGQMTLDPGVTAFSFSAARTAETANDASIKDHQCGVMTFCLKKALEELEFRCTFEQWLERAHAKLEDIRAKYMPMMDQTIQLSFCPHSAPSQVVVFDHEYAGVAPHTLSQQAEQAMRGSSQDGLFTQGGPMPQPVREASTEFVPSPLYQANGSPHSAGSGAYQQAAFAGQAHGSHVGILYVEIFRCYNLKNTDTGILGDVSDPYVKLRVGPVEHTTPVINNNLNPEWKEDNRFTFKSKDAQNDQLELEVVNSNMMRDDILGRLALPLRSLAPTQWDTRRMPLQDGPGEIQFRVRFDPEQGSAPAPQHQQQPMMQGMGAAPSQNRPSSPPRGLGAPADMGLGLGGLGAGGNFFGEANLMAPAADMSPASVGNNIFGEPNLFTSMPDLMSILMKDTGVAPNAQSPQQPPGAQAAAPALSGLGAPQDLLVVPIGGKQAPFSTPMLSSRDPGAGMASDGFAAQIASPGMQAPYAGPSLAAPRGISGTGAGGMFDAYAPQAAPALQAVPSAMPLQAMPSAMPLQAGSALSGSPITLRTGQAMPSGAAQPAAITSRPVAYTGTPSYTPLPVSAPMQAAPQAIPAHSVTQGVYNISAASTPSYQPAMSTPTAPPVYYYR